MPSKLPVAPGRFRVMLVSGLALGLFWGSAVGSPAAAQSGAVDGQWRSYGGDLGHTQVL